MEREGTIRIILQSLYTSKDTTPHGAFRNLHNIPTYKSPTKHTRVAYILTRPVCLAKLRFDGSPGPLIALMTIPPTIVLLPAGIGKFPLVAIVRGA